MYRYHVLCMVLKRIVFTKSDSSVKVGGTKWFKVVNRLPGPQEGVGVARKHAPGGSRVGRAPCRSSGSKSATDCVPRCRRTRSPSQDCADGHDTMADAASRVAHSTRIRKWPTRTASCTPAIDARSGVCGQLLSLPGSRPCCGRLLGRSLLRATTDPKIFLRRHPQTWRNGCNGYVTVAPRALAALRAAC